MNLAEVSGYLAAGLVFLTFYMKTMIPLRIIGLASNCAFILYGAIGGLLPILILHLALLPLNAIRLGQMLRLSKDLREATRGDLNLDWLKPFTTTRKPATGDVLFRKGDVAEDMYVVVSGRYLLADSGIVLGPGDVVGEFGLVAPERRRTQTLVCQEAGTLLHLSYGQVEQLIFQHPALGFYFMKLITGRLMQNHGRLEDEMATLRRQAATGPA
jgi:CRP-like cAMP-binding protein